MTLQNLLDNQPSGQDLLGCDMFLIQLHSLMASNAELIGHLETELNKQLLAVLRDKTLEAEVKLVKSSSTLLMNYVSGIYPTTSKELLTARYTQRVVETVSNDYRTLISAFKTTSQHV